MSDDGQIDFSQYALNELREAASTIDKTKFPINYANLQSALDVREAEVPEIKGPRVDVRSDSHSPPEISTFSFGPRCPACGWRKPLFILGNRFGRPFHCRDCGSRLNHTKTHRRFNVALMAVFFPFFTWFTFGNLESSEKLAISAGFLFLAFFEFWFTRLELINPQ